MATAGQQDSDAISYSVAAYSQTRAADSYCNTSLPDGFKVWALTADGTRYIDGDQISKTSGGWTDEGGTRYWPDAQSLDFYASVNGDVTFDGGDTPQFKDFTVEDEVGKQLDLMYAVKKGMSKSDGTVSLNFRHALAQVCFKARNENSNLVVYINSVGVGNLHDTGTFTLPDGDTSDNYTNHSDDAADATLNSGAWSDLRSSAGNKKWYTAKLGSAVSAPYGEGTVNLTCPGEGHVNGFANVLTLLPQQADKWDPSASTPYLGDGFYFLLGVRLCNVDSKESVIYEGNVAVPAEIDWKPGYRYTYTFVFGKDGDGGWSDGSDGEDPYPVLKRVAYTVSVDDFIPADADSSTGGTQMDTGTGAVDLDLDPDILVNSVDLGLPSGKRWATRNLGAATPYDTGYHYNWGCLEPIEEKEDGYRGYQDCYSYTNYASMPDDISCTEYDAATVEMGYTWRIPTQEDFEELVEHTTTTYTSGADYVVLTSKTNGNSVILPKNGYYFDNSLSGGDFYDYCIPYGFSYWCAKKATAAPNANGFGISYIVDGNGGYAKDENGDFLMVPSTDTNFVYNGRGIRPVAYTRNN